MPQIFNKDKLRSNHAWQTTVLVSTKPNISRSNSLTTSSTTTRSYPSSTAHSLRIQNLRKSSYTWYSPVLQQEQSQEMISTHRGSLGHSVGRSFHAYRRLDRLDWIRSVLRFYASSRIQQCSYSSDLQLIKALHHFLCSFVPPAREATRSAVGGSSRTDVRITPSIHGGKKTEHSRYSWRIVIFCTPACSIYKHE